MCNFTKNIFQFLNQTISFMKFFFRKAEASEQVQIWDLLKQGVIRRKNEGSNQWQDGYPNLEVVKNDIEKEAGYVLTESEKIIGYCAILINDEPEYERIRGNWLSNENFLVFHRMVISESYIGQGLSKKILEFIEKIALNNQIFSIKADTNYDNYAMLKVFEKMNYKYCGTVVFRGSPRKAFEKLLSIKSGELDVN